MGCKKIFVFLFLTSVSFMISWSMHVAVNGTIVFFLRLSNMSLHVCTTSSLSIHLSVDINVACVLAIVNSATMNPISFF